MTKRQTLTWLWQELGPRSAERKHEAGRYGPCYDLCACRDCWRGWSGVSLYQRLRWRLHYLLHRGYA